MYHDFKAFFKVLDWSADEADRFNEARHKFASEAAKAFEERFKKSSTLLVHSEAWRRLIETGDKVGFVHELTLDEKDWIQTKIKVFMTSWS